jgi:hypothetical protein
MPTPQEIEALRISRIRRRLAAKAGLSAEQIESARESAISRGISADQFDAALDKKIGVPQRTPPRDISQMSDQDLDANNERVRSIRRAKQELADAQKRLDDISSDRVMKHDPEGLPPGSIVSSLPSKVTSFESGDLFREDDTLTPDNFGPMVPREEVERSLVANREREKAKLFKPGDTLRPENFGPDVPRMEVRRSLLGARGLEEQKKTKKPEGFKDLSEATPFSLTSHDVLQRRARGN